MKNVSDKFVEKIEIHVYVPKLFLSENGAFYEIMWKSM
jgi:hypothetical protein